MRTTRQRDIKSFIKNEAKNSSKLEYEKIKDNDETFSEDDLDSLVQQKKLTIKITHKPIKRKA